MRYIFIILFSTLAFNSAKGQGSADVIIRNVYNELEKMNPYQAKIEVVYDNDSIWGSYQVDDDNYYISIEEQELYGDSTEKYEVFNSRKEVVIDKVTQEYDGNILSNPATAFSSILNYYSASIISDNNGVTTLELKQDVDSEVIKLEVYNNAWFPKSILYISGEDEVVVNIFSIKRMTSTIKSYDNSNYADYEVIDFR
ncbi:MAG: hypothetical protein SNG81_04750 [Rikenellaceae bacterium]